MVFEKSINIKFHEKQTTASLVVPRGRRGAESRKTDMTKPIVAFRNFANKPKI